MSALALIMMLPSVGTTQDKCKAALDAADTVIHKQDELVLNLQRKNEELMSDNDALSEAIVKLKDTNDSSFGMTAWTGFGGIVLGSVVTALMMSKH